LWRSSDFGEKTISGLRWLRRLCRRSMWKTCAGVDGWQTSMFISAHSCM
jgi:hypothetical protein